jgi:TetR/AcrR family transcriptional regulator
MKGKSVKEVILKSAIAEFSRYGLNGARIDRISDRAQANKRMIYYYFGSKNSLYNRVLEHVYMGIVSAMENSLARYPQDISYMQKIQVLWEEYFHYLSAHPEYVALISWENLQKGKYTEEAGVERVTHPLVEQAKKLLEEHDHSLSDADIRNYLITLLGLGFYYFSNQYTMAMIMGPEILLEDNEKKYIETIKKMIILPLSEKQPSDSKL